MGNIGASDPDTVGSAVTDDSQAPRLSVVIPFYNAAETLGLQLDALAHQRDAPLFEVVVVDNRSSAGPQAVVDQWADQLDIRVVSAPQAQGISCARNVGLATCRSALMALCDADDCAGPDFVRAAVEALVEADFVTGNVVPLDNAEMESGRDYVWAILAEQESGPIDWDAVSTEYPIMMGGACAMRREPAIALGGYDQAFFPGVEDNDFALRVQAAGHTIVRQPGMTLAERRRATNAGAFRRSFDGGRMHMKLCAGHDLWTVSPHLHQPEWWVDLLKLPLAAAKVVASKPTQEQRLALAGRAGLRLGQLCGYVPYRLLRRPVVSQLGIGLS